jgi:hypothetical protein
METRNEKKSQSRFQIVKLEERIAPGCFTPPSSCCPPPHGCPSPPPPCGNPCGGLDVDIDLRLCL